MNPITVVSSVNFKRLTDWWLKVQLGVEQRSKNTSLGGIQCWWSVSQRHVIPASRAPSSQTGSLWSSCRWSLACSAGRAFPVAALGWWCWKQNKQDPGIGSRGFQMLDDVLEGHVRFTASSTDLLALEVSCRGSSSGSVMVLRWGRTMHSKDFISTEVRAKGLYSLGPVVLVLWAGMMAEDLVQADTYKWIIKKILTCLSGIPVYLIHAVYFIGAICLHALVCKWKWVQKVLESFQQKALVAAVTKLQWQNIILGGNFYQYTL